MRYIIYKITNTVNGKIYIGKHTTKDINDGYMGSGKLLKLAIKKYGKEKFKKEILFECLSENEMNKKEKEIVNKNFIKDENNYNLTIGGDGGWSHCNGENHNNKKNHRRIGFLRYIDNGINPSVIWFNKLSDKEKLAYVEKISTSLRKKIKENGSWWFGRHHSDETKKKMSKKFKENNHQKGSKNSQYGKMWIYNKETFEDKIIKKTDIIPDGWLKGRICNKNKSIKIKKQEKEIEKKRKIEEKINNLREMYNVYKEFGFCGVVKKFEYKFTVQNLVQQFSKYLSEFVPKNGKKRSC